MTRRADIAACPGVRTARSTEHFLTSAFTASANAWLMRRSLQGDFDAVAKILAERGPFIFRKIKAVGAHDIRFVANHLHGAAETAAAQLVSDLEMLERAKRKPYLRLMLGRAYNNDVYVFHHDELESGERIVGSYNVAVMEALAKKDAIPANRDSYVPAKGATVYGASFGDMLRFAGDTLPGVDPFIHRAEESPAGKLRLVLVG